MDVEKVASALGIEEWRLRGALQRGTAVLVRDFKPRYLIFRKDLGAIEHGTSVFLGEEPQIIRGFPKIKRAFYLAAAIKRHFGGKVAVEEKMNGYNVRAFALGKKILAVTRGGYVCSYTTQKLSEDSRLRQFFRENDYVLCGEVVGMENPYVTHEYSEAPRFEFFAFDVREKGSNAPLSIAEKIALLDSLSIRRVTLFGIYDKQDAAEKIFEIIAQLERENREGVVIKDPDMKLEPIKYTSSLTNTSDLAYAFRFPYDFGRDFFFQRVMREGYQALEWNEDGEALEKRALKLGKSLLYPMLETMRAIREGKEITEDFLIRVKSRGEIEALVAYLKRQGVGCRVSEVRQEGDELVARLKRYRYATKNKVEAVLAGKVGI